MADGAIATVSGSDLVNAIPADMMSEFNNAADVPDPVSDDTSTEIEETSTPVEEPAAEPEPEPAAVETAADTEPEPEPEPEPKKATPADDLPDGVTAGKNRKGEEGVFVKKDRWENTIQAGYKLNQEISELIGEPLTRQAIEVRDRALQANDKMFADLESGDPKAQGEVVDFILDQMIEAKQVGRTGVDAVSPFISTVYDKLQQKSPEAYAVLRNRAARDLVREIFNDASRVNNEDLFRSAQHLALWLGQVPNGELKQIRASMERMGIPFYAPEEMEGLVRGVNDPLAEKDRQIQALQQQISRQASTDSADQFRAWSADTSRAVHQGILDGAVRPALASIEQAWKPFQKDYDELVVTRLANEVKSVLQNDPVLTKKIELLDAQAKRANQAVRAQIATQIQNLYVNRAKLAAEVKRREVIDFANQSLKGRVDSTHARRQAAQTRTAPQGTTPPVPRSLVPNDALKAQPNEVYDSNKALKQMMSYFG
jgi:hypothetical protein